ncbi:MAG: hypothetical protein ACREH8_02895, partial [Opitutaceae bacterium]
MSCYIPDANHTAAAAYVRRWKKPPRLPLTPFGAYELNNSLRRLPHKGLLLPADLAAIGRMIREDVGISLLED